MCACLHFSAQASLHVFPVFPYAGHFLGGWLDPQNRHSFSDDLFMCASGIGAWLYSLHYGESKGGVADALRMYKQKMTLVCEDNEVTEPAAIARKIKIGLGDEGLRRLNASGLTEQQLQTPTAIWQFLERNLQ
ncbi:hypothetical protein CAPTEDRAFT_197132, partial [Capitella teleta]